MKKIISLALVSMLILALTACTPTIKATATYEYDVYPNTDWGMTKDEVITALNLNEDDCFEVDDLNPNGSYGFSIEQKQFGHNARVDFWFGDDFSENLADIGLIMAIVQLDDTTIDIDKIKTEVDMQLETMDKIHGYDGTIRESQTIENNMATYKSILTADTIKNEQHKEKAIVAIKTRTAPNMPIHAEPLSSITINQDSDTNKISIKYDGLLASISNSVK